MSFLVRLPSTCLDAKMEIVLNTDYRWGGERYTVPHPNHGKFNKRRAAYSSKYGNVAHQLSGNQGDGTSQTRQQPTSQVSALRHSERIQLATYTFWARAQPPRVAGTSRAAATCLGPTGTRSESAALGLRLAPESLCESMTSPPVDKTKVANFVKRK